MAEADTGPKADHRGNRIEVSALAKYISGKHLLIFYNSFAWYFELYKGFQNIVWTVLERILLMKQKL